MDTTTHQQIAFVLDNIADNQTLVAGIPSGIPVYVLKSSGDVLAQMAAITSGYSNLDAIHLYSHGSDGALDLGSTILNNNTLAEHATVLSAIGSSLSENGDILLYGCNVAEGQAGVEFISKLSQVTGADIAASDDLTGSRDKGGDWALEVTAGAIQAQPLAADQYADTLAYTNVEFTVAGIVNGSFLELQNGSSDISGTMITFAGVNDNNPRSAIVNDVGSTGRSGVALAEYVGSAWVVAPEMLDALHVWTINASQPTFDMASFDVYNSTGSDVALTVKGYSAFAFAQLNGSVAGEAVLSTQTAIAGQWTTINLTGFTSLQSVNIDFADNTPLYFNRFYIQNHVANTAPTIGNLPGSNQSITTGIAAALDNFTVADTDGDTLTVTLTATNGTINNLTDTDGGTAGIQLTGAVADINATLTGATFTATADGAASIGISVNDGTAAAVTGTYSFTAGNPEIYIDNATDTVTINSTGGISFSEAIAMAAADGLSSNILHIDSSLANTTIGALSVTSLSESVTLNGDVAKNAIINGGTLDTNGHTLTVTNALTTSNVDGIEVNDKLSIGTTLTGTGSITKSGAGTIVLSGTNTYSGGTTLSNGTLEIAGQSNIGSGGINFASTSNQTPATLSLTNTANTTITSSIAIANANGGVIQQVAGGSGVVTTISGVISGTASGNLTLQGEGSADNSVMPIIKLSGTNTFDGKTIVDIATTAQHFGSVSIASDSNLGSGALEMISGDLIITDSTTIDNAVILNTNNHYLYIGSGKSVVFSGNMSGDNGFGIYSNGTNSQVTFTGTNTNAGGVSVSENATLTLSSTTNSAIKDTAYLGVLGGTVILNQASETIGSLFSNGGSLEIGSNTLTVSGNYDSTFAGSLVGSGNLIIQGDSTHTFAVNSNAASMSGFSGTTTVNSNGKLLLGSGGNLSGAIIVDDTGLLTGDGTALGLVTVKSGGTLGAGNISGYATSVADIDFKGGLTAEAGSTLHFNIKGNTAGSTYDQLKVVGAVNIAGATLTVVDTNYTVTAGTELVLIDNDGTDTVTGGFADLEDGMTVTVNGVDMIIDYQGGDGNDVTLTAPGVANTAPENTISATYTTNEDTQLSITDLAVADAVMDTLTVTLSVNNGTLNLSNIYDVTAIDTDGLDGSISFSGIADNINLMLAGGVNFYPVANENGNDQATLTMTTSDGTADNVVNTAAINVSAVNDTPTFNDGGLFWDNFNRFGDSTYSSDRIAESYASAMQPDGKIVMVGYAEVHGGTGAIAMVRLNTDGSLDESFGEFGELIIEGYYGAESVAIQPDGKILIVAINDNNALFLARLNADGSIDNSFATSGDNGWANVSGDTNLDALYAEKIVVQADGKILLVGGQNIVDGDGGDMAIVRYNADGTLDDTFNSTGYNVINFGNADRGNAAAIQADGKIVIAGSGGNNGDFALARLNADGTLDTSFGTEGEILQDMGGNDDAANAIAIQADGQIVVVGDTNANGNYDIALARLNANGSLDTTFDTDGKVIFSAIGGAISSVGGAGTGNDTANSVAIDKNGNIFVGGGFNYLGENADGDMVNVMFPALIKFNSSGVLDTTIGTNGFLIPEDIENGSMYNEESEVYSNLLIQSDGNVVATAWDNYYSPWENGGDGAFLSSFIATRIDNTTGATDTQFGDLYDSVAYASTDVLIEGGDPVTIGAWYSDYPPKIFDVEQHAADNYAGGTLTIQRNGGFNNEDVLSFDSDMLAAGSVTVVENMLMYADGAFASFTSSSGQMVLPKVQ